MKKGSPVSSIAEILQAASDEFDLRTAERHEAGAKKYGPGKFLEVNTLEEAMQEVLDLGNYARYTYIKLYLLNQYLDEEHGETEINVGAGAFTPSKPTLSTDRPADD